MNRLRKLFRDTFPDLEPHPVGLTVMSLAMLTLYVEVSRKRFMPDAWVEWVESFTGFEDVQLARYFWKDTICALLLMIIPLVLMRVFAGWSARDLGFRLKGTLFEFKLVIVLWIAFLPILWFVSDFPRFERTYPQVL